MIERPAWQYERAPMESRLRSRDYAGRRLYSEWPIMVPIIVTAKTRSNSFYMQSNRSLLNSGTAKVRNALPASVLQSCYNLNVFRTRDNLLVKKMLVCRKHIAVESSTKIYKKGERLAHVLAKNRLPLRVSLVIFIYFRSIGILISLYCTCTLSCY